jgi:cytochrome c
VVTATLSLRQVRVPARVRRRHAAVALVALAAAVSVAGCGPAAPPQSQTQAQTPTQTQTRSDDPAGNGATAAPPAISAPASSAAPPGATAFDVGEIKTVAQYRAEPEFANADLARGKLLSLACAACHTFDAGGKVIIGPNLHGVFGRRAAAAPDFKYSDALTASGLVWTPRALEAWLADPAQFVAGTTMTFTGYRSPEDRRDLIAYLLQATD